MGVGEKRAGGQGGGVAEQQERRRHPVSLARRARSGRTPLPSSWPHTPPGSPTHRLRGTRTHGPWSQNFRGDSAARPRPDGRTVDGGRTGRSLTRLRPGRVPSEDPPALSLAARLPFDHAPSSPTPKASVNVWRGGRTAMVLRLGAAGPGSRERESSSPRSPGTYAGSGASGRVPGTRARGGAAAEERALQGRIRARNRRQGSGRGKR